MCEGQLCGNNSGSVLAANILAGKNLCLYVTVFMRILQPSFYICNRVNLCNTGSSHTYRQASVSSVLHCNSELNQILTPFRP